MIREIVDVAKKISDHICQISVELAKWEVYNRFKSTEEKIKLIIGQESIENYKQRLEEGVADCKG